MIHTGNLYGKVCANAIEGVDLGIASAPILEGGCSKVSVKQLQNKGGTAKFELSIEDPDVAINTIGMTVVFSNRPKAKPTLVRRRG